MLQYEYARSALRLGLKLEDRLGANPFKFGMVGSSDTHTSLATVGPPHPHSPYDGMHPYVYMLVSLYVAWAVLLIRGASDPRANAALFDWGILANVLHGLVMIPQAFIYPNEHAHLWADTPLILVMVVVLWIWHPNRVSG